MVGGALRPPAQDLGDELLLQQRLTNDDRVREVTSPRYLLRGIALLVETSNVPTLRASEPITLNEISDDYRRRTHV